MPTRREVEAAIREHYEVGQEKRALEKRQDAATKIVREYMEAEGAYAVVDGEFGLTARLSRYESAGAFDWAQMDDETILLLARAGAFQAASKATLDALSRALPRVGDAVKRWQMPGGETVRLIIGASK